MQFDWSPPRPSFETSPSRYAAPTSGSPATYHAIMVILAVPFLDLRKARGHLPSRAQRSRKLRARSWRCLPLRGTLCRRRRLKAGAPRPQRWGRPSICAHSRKSCVYSAPDFCTKKAQSLQCSNFGTKFLINESQDYRSIGVAHYHPDQLFCRAILTYISCFENIYNPSPQF